jgi:hypothetical protein
MISLSTEGALNASGATVSYLSDYKNLRTRVGANNQGIDAIEDPKVLKDWAIMLDKQKDFKNTKNINETITLLAGANTYSPIKAAAIAYAGNTRVFDFSNPSLLYFVIDDKTILSIDDAETITIGKFKKIDTDVYELKIKNNGIDYKLVLDGSGLKVYDITNPDNIVAKPNAAVQLTFWFSLK